jgi:CRP-like cAMP-binding protein
MMLLSDVLKTVEFLADGPPGLAAEFMALGRTRTLQRHHVLWRAGQRSESIVVPVTGELAALGRDSGGRGICYAFFGVGQFAGVPAAVDGLAEPREVRVIRGGDFFFVERAAFLRFLDLHSDVRSRVTEFIGRLFRKSLDERDREVFLPVHARVARFLLEHACVRRADGARVLLRESQPEIAIRLGSVREVIAREMAGFADRGLLRRTRHALFVVDWEGLRTKAEYAEDTAEDRARGAAAAALRTHRFFLPMLDGGPELVAEESRICGEHLAEFNACVARGCPLALVAAGADTSPRPPSPNRIGKTERMPASSLSAPPAPPLDVARISTAGARPRHPPHDGVRDESPSRTAQEEHEIRRRIALYRQRVSGIESKFGGDERVPDDATVFRDS